MGESWLYEELGREAVTGKRNTLAVMKSKEGIDAAFSSEFLSRLNPNSIYLTLGTPAEKADVPLSAMDIEWIDATGAKHSPSPGFPVTYFDSARELVRLSAMIGTMASAGNHSFLVVNPLNGILAANGVEKTAEFTGFLANRLASAGMGGLFFILAKPDAAGLVKKISPMFDDVIKF
ncbi:MAG: hypothetical protein WC717_01640 [Candidatus Micrarchaeia archaeon]|jgi:hypothetical protein